MNEFQPEIDKYQDKVVVFEDDENQGHDLIDAANEIKLTHDRLVFGMSYVIGDINLAKFFIDKMF